jgi:hypothetical protein
MRRTLDRAAPRRAVGAAALALVLAATGHLTAGLQAQSGASGMPDLSGIWTRDGRAGTPGELPLNARGVALREAVDESLAPMYDCVPATVPHMLGDPYNFSIEQQADRVLIRYEKDAVLRTVWLDGHGHPKATPNDYAVQGHSTGRYEGNELVVETSKFTFDPAGLEDKPPMVPSSTQKKVVERYSIVDGRLIANLVMEDPLIMTAPVAFRFEFRKTEDALVEWPECDPEQSRAPLNYLPVDQLKYGIR